MDVLSNYFPDHEGRRHHPRAAPINAPSIISGSLTSTGSPSKSGWPRAPSKPRARKVGRSSELDLVNSSIGRTRVPTSTRSGFSAVFSRTGTTRLRISASFAYLPPGQRANPARAVSNAARPGSDVWSAESQSRGWERAAIRKDRTTCTVSMADIHTGGGTFTATRISEKGISSWPNCSQLTDTQVEGLFSAAKFDNRTDCCRPQLRYPSGCGSSSGVCASSVSDGPACQS